MSKISKNELNEVSGTEPGHICPNEQIEQSNLILNAMFNAMQDSVFCKDLEGRYIECNKSFEEFITHTKEEIIGKTFTELINDKVDIVKFYTDVDRTVIEEGKTVTQKDVSMSYNGVDRFYDIIKTPLTRQSADGENETFGLLALMRDVNERYVLIKNLQDTQASLETALERANAGNKAKTEFLSCMSHELLTPMNIIMGMSQIAKTSTDLNYMKTCLDEIYEHSSHLLRLINNLLEVSSGSGTFDESLFSLGALIEYVENRINPYLDRKQQTLNIEVDDSIPKIMIADEKRISKVIFHLLTNASKFSEENNEILLKFDILDEAAERPVLKISVADNGIGMSPEMLNNIFDIFEQGDGSYTRKYQGIGIGLTLSKYIIETMGGTISVESEPDKGSIFTFMVPVSRH